MKKYIFIVFVLLVAGSGGVFATHSWGPYHWARTANPFTIKLGDNVSTAWDAYFKEAAADWSKSSILDMSIVSGSAGNPRNCRAKNGRIEVCNAKYGNNGWLGIAQIWVSGEHITQGTIKLNDTYFTKPAYNVPAWKRLVMCQEVGHPLGLDHQDENFSNPNLGTCMDYTNNPAGPLSNEHPDQHDYEMLETIYAHPDTTNTLGSAVAQFAQTLRERISDDDLDETPAWGKIVRRGASGRPSLYVRDLAHGHTVFTFVTWAE